MSELDEEDWNQTQETLDDDDYDVFEPYERSEAGYTEILLPDDDVDVMEMAAPPMSIDDSDIMESNKKKKVHYECSICQRVLQGKSSLNRHMRNTHNLTPEEARLITASAVEVDPEGELQAASLLKCRICEEVLPSPEALNEHLDEVHSFLAVDVNDSQLAESFEGSGTFEDETTGSETWGPSEGGKQCSVCFKTFLCSGTLNRHMRELHEGKPRFVERCRCGSCGKIYLGWDSLNRHLKSAHGQTQTSIGLRCETCKKTFTNADYLKRHLKSVHKIKEGTNEPRCDLCDKTFSSNGHLRRHVVEVHEGHKRVRVLCQCPVCGKTISGQENLTKHLKVHRGLRRSTDLLQFKGEDDDASLLYPETVMEYNEADKEEEEEDPEIFDVDVDPLADVEPSDQELSDQAGAIVKEETVLEC